MAGAPVTVDGSKRRRLLAALLLEADQTVSVSRLVDAVWEEDGGPPNDAARRIPLHIRRLREWLNRVGAGRELVATTPGGYQLQLVPDQLDHVQFNGLVEVANAAQRAGDLERASGLLRDALALWRGPILGGLPLGRSWQATLTAWTERHMATWESWVDVELRLDRHHDLTGTLRRLVDEHPLRERFWTQLLLALYRSGRQAEALAAYQEARSRLIGLLGLEPGPELEHLQRLILTRDPQLDSPLQATRRIVRPCQLPPAPAHLVGRDTLAAELTQRLMATGELPVVVLTGMPGVGKTALAVSAAHRVTHHYPDGQLFVDLNDEGDPCTALGGVLHSLGLPPEAIPENLASRQRTYRAHLDGRRMLVVIDGAATDTQVAALLPGTRGCGVLSTSRARLDGLVEATAMVPVPPLPETAAAQLLGTVAGWDRVRREPHAVAQLADVCGGLPLALRVVAGTAAARPTWPLAKLAARLANEDHRLAALRLGSLDVAARLADAISQRPEAQQHALAYLAAIPTPQVTAQQAAAALGCRPAEAEETLETLVAAGLLEAADAGYQLPTLLGVYGRQQLHHAPSPHPRRGAA